MKPRLYRRYTDGAEFVVGGGWLRSEHRAYLRELPGSRRVFCAVLAGQPSDYIRSFVLAEFGEFVLCVAGNGRRGTTLAANYAVTSASEYARMLGTYRGDRRWSEVRDA